MRKPAGMAIKSMVCMLCILSLSACWNSRELNTLGIVMGVGIDKAKDGEKVQITAQIIKPGKFQSAQNSAAGAGTTDQFWNVSNSGGTVFATIRDMTTLSSRKLFFPHNEVLIFGKSIAREGLGKYMDFFLRDPETRGTVLILVSEQDAGEILGVKNGVEEIPADNITKLVKGQTAATSQSGTTTLKEFSDRMMSKSGAPVAPMIEIVEQDGQETLRITGTAVFKQDRLVGRLDHTEGRGLLWVLGEIKSGIIEVEGPGGAPAGMEIIRADSKVEPLFREGKLVMKVTITEEGNIGDYSGSENVVEADKVSLLEQKKAEVIQKEIMAAVKKAKQLNADIFGFADAVYRKYPGKWKDMEAEWDEIFREMDVEVTVDARVRLMGRISNPVLFRQG